MNSKSEWLNEYVLIPILGVVFMATWPLVFIWLGLKTFFSDTIKDDKKVKILQEIAEIFGVVIVLALAYWIFGSFEN